MRAATHCLSLWEHTLNPRGTTLGAPVPAAGGTPSKYRKYNVSFVTIVYSVDYCSYCIRLIVRIFLCPLNWTALDVVDLPAILEAKQDTYMSKSATNIFISTAKSTKPLDNFGC